VTVGAPRGAAASHLTPRPAVQSRALCRSNQAGTPSQALKLHSGTVVTPTGRSMLGWLRACTVLIEQTARYISSHSLLHQFTHLTLHQFTQCVTSVRRVSGKEAWESRLAALQCTVEE
jgi:hypothetical protein